MGWFKFAQKQSEHEVIAKIKDILRSHRLFAQIMRDYHIPTEDLDNHMRIIFTDLDGKFAEGNGEEIKLSKKLLDGNFFNNNFHFVVHEFFHWIKRRSEALFYLNDDEEVQSFALAMAWEIIAGKDKSQIAQLFFPLIEGHFQQKGKAIQMYQNILQEAQKIAKTYYSAASDTLPR
jgi:hypothetical protein